MSFTKTKCFCSVYSSENIVGNEKRAAHIVGNEKRAAQTSDTNTIKGKYLCTDCGAKFSFRKYLKDHIIHRHSENIVGNEKKATQTSYTNTEKYSCTECGAKFTRQKYLNYHISYRHSGKRSFVCKDCGADFCRHCELEQHKKSCRGKKESIPCNFCNETFTNTISLKRHQKSHPKKCDVCGKVLRTYSKLIMHRRTHVGEKDFVCRDCGAVFFKKQFFEAHQNSCLTKKK